MGKDTVALSADHIPEVDAEEDEDDNMFLQIPSTVPDNNTSVYSAVSSLCYGKHNAVDLLELCGGAGRISQVAFTRGLESGGNLDITTGVDLGNPMAQKAILHYLDTCNVMVTVLQPNCRSTGPNSHYNSVMHYETWNRHHQQDLPHIKFC